MTVSFAEVLRRYMDGANRGPDVLAKLTHIHKSTIIHWLDKDVKKPRSWKQIVTIADALRLSVSEASLLLRAAGHQSIEELLEDSTSDETKQLLSRWDTRPKQQFSTLLLDIHPPLAPLPRGSHMPLSRNPLFVGRETDLLGIARLLKEYQHVAVTGIGGIGKTQSVSEFVHRYGQYFPGGVFWLSFADPHGVAAEIAICGGVGGLELRPDYATLTLDEQVRLVTAAWQSAVPRLLVFDNCEDEALFSRWRPHSGGCHIIVTSRRMPWDISLGIQTLALRVLERTESLALLRTFHLDTSITDVMLNAIATAVGDLPLALHLAGRYLARYSRTIPISTYLTHLQRPTVLQHYSMLGGGISPTEHTQHLARTFALSYDQLSVTDSLDALARSILVHIAYLAPGTLIPSELLVACTAELADVEQVAHALGRLEELGMLEATVHSASQTFHLHRLLVMFVRQVASDMTAQVAVERVVLTTLQRLNEIGNQDQLLRLQPHTRAVTDTALIRNDEQAADLSFELSRHLCAIEDYSEAQRYNEYSLAIRSALCKDDHPKIVENLHHMGQLLDWQGQYTQARPYHEHALAINKASLDNNHPELAVSFNHVGEIAHALCDYRSAQYHYEQGLIIRQQVCGNHHPSVAESLNNLGLLYNAMGRYREAQPYLEQAVAICEEALKPNDPMLALVLNNFGYLLRAQGAYSAAEPYLERALSLREKIYGPHHTYVAITLNHLGRLNHYRGDYAQARSYLERTLSIRQMRYRPQHAEIANSLGNLGMLLYDMGDITGARPYLEQALAINMKELGELHRHTARSLNHLGLLLYAEGNTSTARTLLEQALAVREAVLGPTHPDTGNSLGNIGEVACETGDIIIANTLLARALALHQQVLGDNHPYTARSYLRMGRLFQKQRDFSQAQLHFERALSIYQRVLGSSHPFTVLSGTLSTTL